MLRAPATMRTSERSSSPPATPQEQEPAGLGQTVVGKFAVLVLLTKSIAEQSGPLAACHLGDDIVCCRIDNDGCARL